MPTAFCKILVASAELTRPSPLMSATMRGSASWYAEKPLSSADRHAQGALGIGAGDLAVAGRIAEVGDDVNAIVVLRRRWPRH